MELDVFNDIYWLTPMSDSLDPGVIARWSVRQTDTHSSLRIPPSPRFSVTCFSRIIWALCKTSPSPSHHLVCNFTFFPRSLSSHSTDLIASAPALRWEDHKQAACYTHLETTHSGTIFHGKFTSSLEKMSLNKNYKYTLWALQDSHMIVRRLEVKFAACCDLWDKAKSAMGNDPMLQVAAPPTDKIQNIHFEGCFAPKPEDAELELGPKWVWFLHFVQKTLIYSKCKQTESTGCGHKVEPKWGRVPAQEVKGQRAEHRYLRNANIKIY